MKKFKMCISRALAAMLLTGYLTGSLTGCGTKTDIKTEITETSAETAAAAVTSAKAETTKKETKKKEIKPLSPGRDQAYFENGEFSVTAELCTLMSSLYYPDIVNDYGVNPELFVVTVGVKAKNMTEEDKPFDPSRISLSGMFSYDGDMGDTEEFAAVKSGKSAYGELRFLCSLEQAAGIKDVLYGGEYFDIGEEFYPEEFNTVVETQSDEDVAGYLYRKYFVHGRQGGHFWLGEDPVSCELSGIKALEADGKNYLSVTYTFYNRSDYARIIEPKAFNIMCGKNRAKAEDYSELTFLPPLYISVDGELVHDPQGVDLQLKGRGELYEIPEFVCMTPENPTEFTLIYDFDGFSTVMGLMFRSEREEACYFDISRFGYGMFNWDPWEEDFFEPIEQ